MFSRYMSHHEIFVPFHIGEGALECQLPIKFSENKKSEKPWLPTLRHIQSLPTFKAYSVIL